MCGIAGLVHFDGRPVDRGVLQRMCDAIRHRGPDEEGVMTWPPPSRIANAHASAGLGSRRLSIVDVQGGHQPIANETDDVWVVQNGEIYNFAEVREQLLSRGHRFATRSDTEVIVHAYEEYGEQFVEHLDGMFAIAIWDSRHERLVLARDRFGKKPLCYSSDGTQLAFSSELRSLLEAPGISRDLDREALGDYLAYMSVPAPRTIYRGVRKLPPAHVLVADRNGVRVTPYWTLDYGPKDPISERDATARVLELLTAAVQKRLMSEVPLGAFLSGGVDSSAVVALMARLSSRPVKTFSIGFDEARFNELPHAKRIADAFGCEHHEFVVRPDAVEALPGLVRHFGEPFADSSAIPTSYLAKLTRTHVTVALSGDGGDEVFGGYHRHAAGRLAEWVGGTSVTRGLSRLIAGSRSAGSYDRHRTSRVMRLVIAASRSRAARYRGWAGVFTPELIAELAPGASSGQQDVDARFAEVAELDSVDALLAVDTRFYLPTDLLVKMDITTMMHSLEARSPFLDRALAEFVARLPSAMKVRRLTTKHLLKQALTGLVPAENLHREKRGFAVPIGAWFRGELREFLGDHLRSARIAAGGLVEQRVVTRLIEEHAGGVSDRAHELWTLLMLELWYREFVTP